MSLTNIQKFFKAVKIIKSDVQLTVNGDVTSQEDFDNNIMWNIGVDGDNAIQSTSNPHSELTWTAVKEEMDKL